MDCYYSKMHTFRHFLFLNNRRNFGGSHLFRTLKFLHTSKASNRDIYSLTHALQIFSHNTVNIRGTDFRRAWIHTNGRRLMPDMNNRRISSTSGSSSAGSGNGNGDGFHSPSRKKSGKGKTFWVCNDCGDSFGQWWGYCPACNQINTLKRFTEELAPLGGGAGTRAAELIIGGCRPDTEFRDQHTANKAWVANGTMNNSLEPQRLSDVAQGHNEEQWRIPLTGPFGTEVGRVLGGGLIPGSLILIGGDPGVGKSTLLLQISATLSKGCEVNKPAPVLYVSAEESVDQIASRASRMQIDSESLFLYSGTDVEDIINKINELSPRAVVVDSIQTVYLKGATGSRGDVTQVKECTTALLLYAKKRQIPIFLVGHVTKTGDIAGPRVLEHIVDVVLYLEGDRLLSHRILRAVKNRFGSTDEIGVLEMGRDGLQAIKNPSELYISERNIDQDVLAGLALTVIIDGSRPFLIETQALCYIGRSSGTTTTRRFNGVQDKRADLIIAVLGRQVGLDLHESSIFLNVVGGVRVEETAADLAFAASICSSFLEIPIPLKMAFIGEIGLGGELRTVARMDKRINELTKLGFTRCVIPTSSMNSISGLEWEDFSIIHCKNVREVIKKVFKIKLKPVSSFMRVEMEGEGQQEVGSEARGKGEQMGEIDDWDEDQHEGWSEEWDESEKKHVSVSVCEQTGVAVSEAWVEGQQEGWSEAWLEGQQMGGIEDWDEGQHEGGGEDGGEGEKKHVSARACEKKGVAVSVGTCEQKGVTESVGTDEKQVVGVEQKGVTESVETCEQKGVAVSVGTDEKQAVGVEQKGVSGGCVGEKNGGGRSWEWSVGEQNGGGRSQFNGGSDGRVGEQNGGGRSQFNGGSDGRVGDQNSGGRSENGGGSFSRGEKNGLDRPTHPRPDYGHQTPPRPGGGRSQFNGGSDGRVGDQNSGGRSENRGGSPRPDYGHQTPPCPGGGRSQFNGGSDGRVGDQNSGGRSENRGGSFSRGEKNGLDRPTHPRPDYGHQNPPRPDYGRQRDRGWRYNMQ